MSQARRRIDHLVHAVRDLEAASELYRRLGFRVGACNRHTGGTENRLVQFGSSFVELITVGDRPEEVPPHEPGAFQHHHHPNGATDIRGVTLAAPEPGSHAGFLKAFTGSAPARSAGETLAFALRKGGHLDVRRRPGTAGLASFAVAVPDLAIRPRS
jgi:catechol 2,3-dioxygenase-like lactoylglutathione lyase family enzyme